MEKYKNQIINECQQVSQAGLDMVTTIRSSDTSPVSPPQDLLAFRHKLKDIITKTKPEIVSIEYKETSDLFYSGSFEQYLQQLKIACEVSHSLGVFCTNGGMESDFVVLLVYADLVGRGKIEQALQFVNLAFNKVELSAIQNQKTSKRIKEILSKGKNFLEAYIRSGVDYINIHWTVENEKAFEIASKYIAQRTGIPIISTEIKVPQNLKKVHKLMKKVADLKYKCAIWFFGIEGQNLGEVKKLSDFNSNSKRFKNFTEQRYNRFLLAISQFLSRIYIVKIISLYIIRLYISLQKKMEKNLQNKSHSKSILIVDDEMFIREIYADIFESQGFETVQAVGGTDALDKLNSRAFNIILLDLMMPDIDGINLLETIKQNPPKFPVGKIVITTNLEPDSLQSLQDIYNQYDKNPKNLNIYDQIVKANIEPQELVERISKLLI
jgi:CheY-like chemotaxis protein